MSEGTVLILLIPKSVQLPERAETLYSGARLSSLIAIHKALSRCSLDWEATTIDAERPAIINDDTSEKAREWLRNNEEKLLNSISLDDIRSSDFNALIVPNMLGILGFYEKSPIHFRLSNLIQEFEAEKKPILTIGLGIAAGLSCKNT
jgi:putative intracellular protease/amidase